MSENKEFEVVWKIKLDAKDEEHAARKAADLLRSRQPIAFEISTGKGKKQTTMSVAPYLTENVISTVKRFLPTATVKVDLDGAEAVYISVITDHFRDIPRDAERIEFINSLLGGLPKEFSDRFYFSCYTEKEHAEEQAETDEWDDDEQPGGEAPTSGPVGWAAAASKSFHSKAEKNAMDLATNEPEATFWDGRNEHVSER